MPNGADKKLNFVAKVWDEKAKAYKPLYIAPDATNNIQGDVYLSDSVSGTQDAASGMTAATPKAVKAVQDSANAKLDKNTSNAQTVAGKVTFTQKTEFPGGISIPDGQTLSGNVSGNASTASALQTSRKISVKVGNATSGSVGFNGTSDVTISVPQVDASVVTTGVLPISVVPQAALERLVKVDDKTARLALTTSSVQLGDSVLQLDTGVMYIVVDAAKLNSEAGYQEYKAGTAASVPWSGVTDKPSTFAPSAHTHALSDMTGQVKSAQIADGAVTEAKTNFNYAGSSSKGGAATSAAKLASGQAITVNGDVTTSSYTTGGFDGTKAYAATVSINNGAITSAKLGDGAVLSDKLASNSVTSTKIADGAVGTSKLVAGCVGATQIADAAISAAKLANLSVSTSKIANGAVTSTKLASKSVTNEKLSDDVGTVYVGSTQPTDSHVKIWVKV